MLDANTLEWLDRRKIGMCCRCENYADCQWIPQPRGHFQTAQCWRFKSSDGYCIDKNDYMDAAEFEARVAKKLCDPFWNYAVTERYFELALPYRRLPASVVLKAARLEVEVDMIEAGKQPRKRNEA